MPLWGLRDKDDNLYIYLYINIIIYINNNIYNKLIIRRLHKIVVCGGVDRGVVF